MATCFSRGRKNLHPAKRFRLCNSLTRHSATQGSWSGLFKRLFSFFVSSFLLELAQSKSVFSLHFRTQNWWYQMLGEKLHTCILINSVLKPILLEIPIFWMPGWFLQYWLTYFINEITDWGRDGYKLCQQSTTFGSSSDSASRYLWRIGVHQSQHS